MNNNYNSNNQQQDTNPNSGYLSKNQYGFFGKVKVTPEMLAEIAKTGIVMVSVSEPKQHSNPNNGDTWVSAYCGLKVAQQPQEQQGGYNQAPQAPAQQSYQQPAMAPSQAPVNQQQYGQAPAPQGQQFGNDEIPF